MVSRAENDLLTRIGPATPAGELLRRYWQPAALSQELPPGGAPLPVRLLGEDLVLFRDDSARPGLLGLHCSHRGADLSYGRLEDGGLRCIYHGWLYDVHGNCLEQPGEPGMANFGLRNAESSEQSPIRTPQSAIKHLAYPCQELGDIIFAYLGPGEPPLLPHYEPLIVPREYRVIRKYFQDCNYLQANEGNFDPVHGSFLHRQFIESERRNGDRAASRSGSDRDRVRGTDLSVNALYNLGVCPRIELEDTVFGVRMYAIRDVGPDKRFVKVLNFVMPNLCAVPGGSGTDGFNLNWHVPTDDEHHWKYMITGRRSMPIGQEAARREYAELTTPDRRLRRNPANRYLQDRDEMKSDRFAGMGPHFPVHDAYATETQGPIQDRTQERLGYSDRGVVAIRQRMLRAIHDLHEGREPPHVIRDPAENNFPDLVPPAAVVGGSEDWRTPA